MWQVKGTKETLQKLKVNTTDIGDAVGLVVAVHAFVIPDVFPTGSHPWSCLLSFCMLIPLFADTACSLPIPLISTTKSATNDAIRIKRDMLFT